MRRALGILSATLVLTALAGCSSEDPAPSAAPTTPAAAPAPAASATPSAAPTPAGWTAPTACAILPVELGGTLSGEALGACVQDALSGYGSGRERLSGEGLEGEIEFVYGPDFAFQGALESGDGPIEMTFLDGELWIDDGSGPVHGDVDSDDPDELLAGMTGELYRIYADPAFAADLVAASAEWRVADAREMRTLPSGDQVNAYRIVSAAPFRWYDLPVEEYVLWFAEDWTPVGAQSSASALGVGTTVTQEFYDLGADITITPVG